MFSLKPANYLLNHDMCLKVTDFGLATVYDDPVKFNAAKKNTTCGTPNYICP